METTALTAVTQFAHHGMVFVPCGYSFGELGGVVAPLSGGGRSEARWGIRRGLVTHLCRRRPARHQPAAHPAARLPNLTDLPLPHSSPDPQAPACLT